VHGQSRHDQHATQVTVVSQVAHALAVGGEALYRGVQCGVVVGARIVNTDIAERIRAAQLALDQVAESEGSPVHVAGQGPLGDVYDGENVGEGSLLFG